MQETANFNYVFEQFFVLKNFTTGVWVIFGIAVIVSANLKCTTHLHEKCTSKKGH